jgi:hypothetical protein
MLDHPERSSPPRPCLVPSDLRLGRIIMGIFGTFGIYSDFNQNHYFCLFYFIILLLFYFSLL